MKPATSSLDYTSSVTHLLSQLVLLLYLPSHILLLLLPFSVWEEAGLSIWVLLKLHNILGCRLNLHRWLTLEQNSSLG